MPLRALWRTLLLVAALPWAAAGWAQDLRPVPPLSGRVIDQTATLSAAQGAALDAKLAAFEAEAGPQIVLLLVPATAPEDIAAYAQRVADSWKIGRREVGDGVLVVVAKDERKLRIEVAKALEGAIPDLAARQIIDQAMRPAFRAGDYAGGLNAGVDRLMQRIRGEGLPAPAVKGGSRSGLEIEKVGLFFLIVVPLVGSVLTGIFGRKLGTVLTAAAAAGVAWWVTASLLLAAGIALLSLVVVGVMGTKSLVRALSSRSGSVTVGGWSGDSDSGGGGSGSFDFGGGSSDNFSSGGGGDFGGGGASGDW